LTGSLTAPKIAIVFPAPFALTLAGAVDIGTNTTTFTGLPDIPLTDLMVTLTGGKNSAFVATCTPPSGTASSTLTSQSGARAIVSAPFTVAGCTASPGGGGGPSPGKPAPNGRPGIVSATVSGLARGVPVLSFKLTAGKNAKLRSFTVKLPRGLRFVRHRVQGHLKLVGVSLAGATVRSAALLHGALTVALRRAVNTVSVRLSPRALRESAALERAARHHRIKRLELSVLLEDTSGGRTSATLPIR
jgi:hypothetical protein